MKYKLIVIFFQIALTSFAFAQERSKNEVLDIFNDLFTKELKQEVINGKNLCIEPLTKDGKIYMYVVNNGNCGWAIISNEKQYKKIIGYSKSGYFFIEKETMPCGLKLLLEHHCNMIDSLRSNNSTCQQMQSRKRQRHYMPAISSHYTLESKLLVKNGNENLWQQSKNNNFDYTHKFDCSRVYNKFCPTFYTADCDHCIVGCSAVALGQILWYWQWPDYAEIPKNINRYGGVSGGTVKRYYDWDNMPCYLYNSTDMYTVDAVAKFLRDCGYAEEMWYGGNDWSMAGIAKIKRAMERNFNLHYTNVHEYSWVDMEQILIDEIESLRPVLCQAWSDTAVNSHSFVVDGYNIVSEEVKYHINIGWGGYRNGFYDLGFGTYNINRTFLTEIYPDCSVRSDVINGISETQIISDTIANYYSTNDIILNQTNSPLTIENGGHLITESGSSITLKPGFHAKAGSSVRLSIKDHCFTTGPYHKKENTDKIDDTENIKTTDDTELYIYPNYSDNHLTINSHEELSSIRIYNIAGQCVMQTRQTDIDVSSLSAGVYIVVATTSDGISQQSKFIHH